MIIRKYYKNGKQIANYTGDGNLKNIDIEDYDEMVELNIEKAFEILQEILPALITNEVIFVSKDCQNKIEEGFYKRVSR